MSESLEFPTSETLGRPLGRYSHVVVLPAGRTAHIAGQLSVADGKSVGAGDFETQMRQVFANLGRVLAVAGSSFDRVAKFTTYLVDGRHIAAFYAVRTELFAELYPSGRYPANTLLVVDRLVEEVFLIEVEAVASVPEGGAGSS